MKIRIILISIITLLIISCSEEDTPNSVSTDLNGFSFTGITTTDSLITPNKYSKFVANATGEELSYKWSVSQGTILGTGKEIQFTICHATDIKIKCIVTDKFKNTATKELNFLVTNDIQIQN